LTETHAAVELQALVRRYRTSSTQDLLKYVYIKYLRRDPQPGEALGA
jgi:hypothetical protein